jgi:hypothetical protein
VDAATIATRKCFLCPNHLPPEQRAVPFKSAYQVLVNPFPILPKHFTIPTLSHMPQRIGAAFADLLSLAHALGDRFVTFYNGPRCGASAPDHLHFQAGNVGGLPLEVEIAWLRVRFGRSVDDVTTLVLSPLRPFILLEHTDASAVVAGFARAYTACAAETGAAVDDEPMLNVLAWHADGRFRVVVLPRAAHRPSFYFADGNERILLSPASIDLCGLCVCAVERDFDRITPDHLRQMLREVCPTADTMQRLTARLNAT